MSNLCRSYVAANDAHRFDSSVGRGDFVTNIGVGKVIKGELYPF